MVPEAEFIPASQLYDPATGQYLYPWVELQIQAAFHQHPRARTDGGRRERPAPEDDPFACSICGHYLATVDRIEGHDYCSSCRREYGPDEYGGDRR